MADNFKLSQARDTVYSLNGYGALSGLQRFNYNFSANEEEFEEIGSAILADTAIEPETSLSFEITDTGSLAAVLARMRYDYDAQAYSAGATTDITTNAFTFTHDDMQYLIFTAGEYKAPGGTFSEAVLFPYHFVTSVGLRLSSDNVGTVSFDAQGSLFKPIYKPYHTAKAYPVTFASSTTVDIAAGWSVASGTHNLLALEINHEMVDDTNLTWADTDTVTIAGGDTVDADDRLMLWAFERTPGSLPTIDYVNTLRFVKPDRINIWLMPSGTAHTNANKYLRVQSVDLTIDVSRDELKEISKNANKTSTFYWAPRYPLDITGQLRVLETDLTKWAELQDKTLNESATTSTVDANNILNIADWVDSKVVVEWYKYGSDDPIQRLVSSGVTFTGYDSTQEVGGRKEATWNISTSQFVIQGFDV